MYGTTIRKAAMPVTQLRFRKCRVTAPIIFIVKGCMSKSILLRPRAGSNYIKLNNLRQMKKNNDNPMNDLIIKKYRLK